jgi:hypoxanthine phosphoribosyltransferase
MKPALPALCDRVVLDEKRIAERVAQLGAQIAADHAGRDLRLVTALRGGLFFTADLARAIEAQMHVDFMAISPYVVGQGGVARITKDLDEDIAGCDVILVEDVVDTGLTIHYLLKLLRSHQPRTLEVCALLDKRARRIADIPIAYTGFDMGEEFLVGYGLDLQGRYRNLPFVAQLSRETLSA